MRSWAAVPQPDSCPLTIWQYQWAIPLPSFQPRTPRPGVALPTAGLQSKDHIKNLSNMVKTNQQNNQNRLWLTEVTGYNLNCANTKHLYTILSAIMSYHPKCDSKSWQLHPFTKNKVNNILPECLSNVLDIALIQYACIHNVVFYFSPLHHSWRYQHSEQPLISLISTPSVYVAKLCSVLRAEQKVLIPTKGDLSDKIQISVRAFPKETTLEYKSRHLLL